MAMKKTTADALKSVLVMFVIGFSLSDWAGSIRDQMPLFIGLI